MFCDTTIQLARRNPCRIRSRGPNGSNARLLSFTLAVVGVLTAVSSAGEKSIGIISRIPHHPVESRALASVGYSARLRALEITFKRGGTYRYLEVPRSVYRELLAAESKARFYNANVRGKYRSVYVRPRKAKVAAGQPATGRAPPREPDQQAQPAADQE